ncbi:MAG: hypothetical protein HY242_00375 [Afipia sp.]|nr:hypothetical protein [Afipia sp.]
MAKDSGDQYSKKESAERMAAALRGARIAQPKPMKDKPKKRESLAKTNKK